MKRMIISDIHGAFPRLRDVLRWADEWSADQILVLGDILYHGPRNDLPEGYDPKSCIELINQYKEKIVAVRGNCDSEVDQMVLSFPIMADYALIYEGSQAIFLTHGHVYNEAHMPALKENDIFLSGHTHIPRMEQISKVHMLNPGSISIPKQSQVPTFGLLEDGVFTLCNLDGESLAVYHCRKEML